MIARISILSAILAFSVSAQTDVFRTAIDPSTRADSADYLSAAIYDSCTAWLPFAVAPTSTTANVGNCAPSHSIVSATNAASAPSWSTNGMTFDGTNDVLWTTPITSSVWTIEAWLRLRSFSATRRIMSAETSTTNAGFSAFATTAGAIGILLRGGSTNVGDVRTASSSLLPSNVWTHVIIAFAGPTLTNRPSIYVNGTNQSTYLSVTAAVPAVAFTAGVMIAGTPTASSYWFGDMDGVVVYTQALSGADASNRYQHTKAGYR